MHRWVAVLLLVLVPLRVFGAEAVGICMLEQAQVQAQSMDSMPDDCPMKSQMQTPQGDHKPKPAGECGSCQLCMPLAGPDAIPFAAAAMPASRAPVVFLVHFASAELRLSLRPPTA